MSLSIIVPVYNGGGYLEKCINNILQQNYNKFEIIIINDGSKDNTYEICERIKQLDGRIKVIHSPNMGVSEARNIGIANSNGKYLAFIDCDDHIEKDMYRSMISKLEEEDLDLVMCSYISEYDNYSSKNIFPWDDKILNINHIKDELIPRLISKIDKNGYEQDLIMGSIWRAVFKKEILDKNNILFNKEIKYSEDLVFLIQYLFKCKKIFTTNECYYFYNKKTNLQLSTTQKYVPNLSYNLNYVDNEILKIFKRENMELNKNWYLRIITNDYIIMSNICHFTVDKSFTERVYEMKKEMSENNFIENINLLSKNELYGLRKIVIFCLKYKLYFLMIIYFTYICRIKEKIRCI